MTMDARLKPTNISRRAALLGFSAGTFLLATRLAAPASAQQKKYGGDGMPGGVKDDPRIFLSIEGDGTIVLLCHRAEMGQGVRTSWAMVVADELEADIARVRVVKSSQQVKPHCRAGKILHEAVVNTNTV